MPTIAEIEKSNRSGLGSNGIYDLILLYNYSDKTKSGTLIPTQQIISMDLTEDIFGHLPRLTIKFSESGTWFHSLNFKAGTKLFMRLYPHVGEDENIPAPYLEGIYALQSYINIADPESGVVNYTLEFIYEAYSYLNKVCIWPKDEKIPGQLEKSYTSAEIVPMIAGQGGLEGTSIISTSDKTTWVNTNLTCFEFIKKIIDHAWVDEEDAPIGYINRDGKFIYTSIRTLAKNPRMATYAETTKYNAEQKADGTYKEYKRLYSDVMVDNRSYMSHEGGNAAVSYVYNPYATIYLSPKIKFIPVLESANSYQSYRYFETYAGKRQPMIAGESNLTNSSSNVRHISNDMYFLQTHGYYDIAPLHNRNVIKSFFQVFAHMTVNANIQMNKDAEANQRLKLGDKIYIDFTTKHNNVSVENGDFVVASITHTVTAGAAYTLMVTGVRDTVAEVKERSF